MSEWLKEPACKVGAVVLNIIGSNPIRPTKEKNVAKTKTKGDLGVGMIIVDALKKHYKVAIPLSEDSDYDLIVDRNGKLEKVQCKYTESNGKVICAYCYTIIGRSSGGYRRKKYTQKMIDWLAIYDKTTDRCYYIPSSLLGNGRSLIHLRLVKPRINQKKRVHWAKDFLNW